MDTSGKNGHALSDQCSELEKIEINLLLSGVFQYYGFDFRDYAFSSIRRRIWHRVHAENLSGITALLDKILHDPSVMEKLYLDFSINVTEMFRDPAFFVSFREKIIPALKDLPIIRIWHAGCSTGEEVYSMAILLKEAGIYHKTRLYATDMNDKVLQNAKLGRFPLRNMQNYTSNYIKMGGEESFSKYYNAELDYVSFDKSLSKNIVFAQHNLVTDGSFNEFHVIICRNVLIYFNKHLQNRVHQLMYESLAPSGYIGLGNREGLSYTHYSKKYEVIDKENKLYRKV